MPRSSDLPSEEQFKGWLRDPCTLMFREYARRRRMALMETWARGEFSAAFDVEMAVKNAGATGACSIWEEVIEPVFQSIIDEVTDGEPSGEQLGADPGGTRSAD